MSRQLQLAWRRSLSPPCGAAQSALPQGSWRAREPTAPSPFVWGVGFTDTSVLSLDLSLPILIKGV